jgi:molybdenum cofactor synthesis domain-containing protein
MKTAQILIVGDEILSGRTKDTNSGHLAKALGTRGVRVNHIAVVPDNEILISQWLHHRHALSDYVFVCGGIGGTPDDVTRQSVARACGVPVVRNAEAERILLRYYGDRVNPERMNMADLPRGCELISNPLTHAPGFKIKNIYVFAGIPKILYAMWDVVKGDFEGTPLFEAEINLKVGEGEISHHMKQINKEFPLLELGSYPTIDTDQSFKTQLVFRSVEDQTVKGALARFRELCAEVDVFA